MTPEMDRLCHTEAEDQDVPEIEDMLKIKSLKNLGNLETAGMASYSAQNIIPIPPFMLNREEQVTRAAEGRYTVIIFDVINLIIRFDEELTLDLPELEFGKGVVQRPAFLAGFDDKR